MTFSFLLSLYIKEKPEYFDRSMKSIFEQNSYYDEVVLVIDGQITYTLEVLIEKWKSKFETKLVIEQLQENVGLSAALNVGLNRCKSEYVVRMDTDDIAASNRIQELKKVIESNSDLDIIGSYAEKIDENEINLGLLKVPVTNDEIKRLIWTCPMIHPTVCYNRKKIIKIGGYNPDAGPRQDDYELWYRCAENGLRFQNIPKVLLFYRFTDDNIKKNNLSVGYHRFKVGWKGNRKLKLGTMAYIGVAVPLVRALIPYPFNVWFYKISDQFNPRTQ